MKKSIYSIAVLLGVLFLTACGSDEEMPYEKKAPEVKKEAVVEKEEDKKQDSPESKAYVYDNPVTLTLETCGTLKELLGDSLTTADKLVLAGPLDANDVSIFLNNMPALLSLDLTETTFVKNSLTFCNHMYSTSIKLSLKENEIVPYMFYRQGYNGLKEIKLPKGITKIGHEAFYYSDKLESVILPEGLLSIGDYAFAYNYNLTNLVLPQSLKTIGERAFMHCHGLTNIGFPESMESIGTLAFGFCYQLKEVVLPKSLTSMGVGVFEECTNLTSVTLSSNKMSGGEGCFLECTKLKEVNLPEGLETIPERCFRGCTSLKTIEFPASLTTIGKSAFNSAGLTSITIPEKIKSISDYAFYNCYLATVVLPEGLTSIGRDAFRANLLSKIDFLPESLTSLGAYVFAENYRLTEVTLPENITVVPERCFYNCQNLTQILSEGITYIGSYAFQNTAITNLDFLPEGLKSINSYAFTGCKLDKVLRFPSTLTTLADYALDGLSARVAAIYLPGTSGNVTVGNIFGIDTNRAIKTSNCLIYTEGSVSTHSTLPNVVINKVCLSLVLAEGTPFHCPEAFTAGKVTFKKQFNQTYEYTSGKYIYELYSTKGKASHWYGLSLPFTVTEITTADGRTFAPFNSDVEGANPFWLRRPSSSGFENMTRIEAGEPYIIAFPCNESYDDVYNVWGDVTFVGKNVSIPVTEDYSVNGAYYSMNRSYDLKPTAGNVYLLNSPRHGYYVSDSSSYDSVNPQGRRGNNNYGWGSCFVPNLRQSWAFEAYLSAGITTSYFSVTPESASRSVRTLGAVPQIDDM